MKKDPPTNAESASALIDARIAHLGDWRGALLAWLRALIRDALPEVREEWKCAIPVWSHNGLICTGETYKKVVKMTFAKGAALPDPSGLFNASLGGQGQARHRLPRRPDAGPGCPQSADPCRRCLERVAGARLIRA